MSSSTVTYTLISSDYEEPSDTGSPGVIFYGYDGLPMHLLNLYVGAALQALGQAPRSPNYVPGPKHPHSPDYVPGLEKPEQASLSPVYVLEPEYPEYLVPSDGEAPREDQPLPDDASPIALSLGYVADSDLEEDSEEDPKEDSTDYPANGGDDDDDESSDDNDDDDDVKEDKDEEEEHLTLADSTALLVVDPVPLAENTKAFKTDESAATPPAPPVYQVARLLDLPTPPPSSLTPLSSPLPQIPSPPLPVLSLPLPLSPPTTSPTYAEVPLGYKEVEILDCLPEADMLLQKRAHFTAPTSKFKIGESLSVVAARQAGHALAHKVDYGFMDTMDASIRAAESRVMTAVEVANARVTDLATTHRQDAQDLYMLCEEAHDDRALIGAQELSHFESRIQAIEAQIRALQRDMDVLQRQRIRDEDRMTTHIQHEHEKFRKLIHTAKAGPQDGPEDAGSSY
ncbi:hypothetical protein Tco_0089157 [Tanacetum coccineum]